jgi:hypothetical protein
MEVAHGAPAVEGNRLRRGFEDQDASGRKETSGRLGRILQVVPSDVDGRTPLNGQRPDGKRDARSIGPVKPMGVGTVEDGRRQQDDGMDLGVGGRGVQDPFQFLHDLGRSPSDEGEPTLPAKAHGHLPAVVP